MICCAPYTEKSYSGSKKLHFYHGPKLQDILISIVSHTPEEIEFRIKTAPSGEYLYHFILDEEETRVSEGWFPTQLSTAEPEHYTVKMKAKKGLTFKPGKKYRLCVGSENPDAVFYRTNYYKCLIDYEFEIPEK
jgi:hypothetical protein